MTMAIRLFLFLPLLALAQQVGSPADAVLGEWTTAEGKARVRIYRCDSAYCGKITWLREPLKDGRPILDTKNPDPQVRDQGILGIALLRGFLYDGENVWTAGTVYDPESGDTYSGKLTLVDDKTLELRGYVLLPLFGRSETWTRP